MTERLAKSIDLLQTNFEHHKRHNPKVSSGDVAWHIDHCCRVMTGISKALHNSNPKDFKSAWNFGRFVVLTSGSIPRGRAKAPQSVQSQDEITIDNLENLFRAANENITLLHSLNPNSHFLHPYFESLNLKQSIRFIEVHNNHHLKIIRDIMK